MQTGATLLDATCFVHLHTLLHVVKSCCAKFEVGHMFSYVRRDSTTRDIAGPLNNRELKIETFRGDGDRSGRASLEQRQPSLSSKIRTLRSQ